MSSVPKTAPENSAFTQALEQSGTLARIPKVGETVKGNVISASRREVRIDLDGLTTGVIRGRELFSESKLFENMATGAEVEATVIALENENGDVELSFRFAGQQKVWDELKLLAKSGDILPVTILEANKGGLIVKMNHTNGFLPVSQLSPDHYPRVAGGDKNKILERLKTYVGATFDVRIMDVNEKENKIIVSEKNVWEEKQKNVIAKYKVGDRIEGPVTAIADFGAFVKFDGLEGLVHISEIAWQRIDHPGDVLKIGQEVNAQIIGLEGSKIFLSMKKLVEDPWAKAEETFHVGDVVQGKILKVNPFGFFVELTPEIHGLAHVSELADTPVTDVTTIGKEGDVLSFTIVSVEAKEHRLGLSLKTQKEKPKEPEVPTPEAAS